MSATRPYSALSPPLTRTSTMPSSAAALEPVFFSSTNPSRVGPHLVVVDLVDDDVGLRRRRRRWATVTRAAELHDVARVRDHVEAARGAVCPRAGRASSAMSDAGPGGPWGPAGPCRTSRACRARGAHRAWCARRAGRPHRPGWALCARRPRRAGRARWPSRAFHVPPDDPLARATARRIAYHPEVSAALLAGDDLARLRGPTRCTARKRRGDSEHGESRDPDSDRACVHASLLRR